MRHHPDDVHALVISRIMSMPKDSPESQKAYRDYCETRERIKPKQQMQAALLEKTFDFPGQTFDHVKRVIYGERVGGVPPSAKLLAAIDAKVLALDDEIAAEWLSLDSRLGEYPQEAA